MAEEGGEPEERQPGCGDFTTTCFPIGLVSDSKTQ